MENFANRSITALDLIRRILREDAIEIVSINSIEPGPTLDVEPFSPGAMIELPGCPTITISLIATVPVDHLDHIERVKNDYLKTVQQNPYPFIPKGWRPR